MIPVIFRQFCRPISVFIVSLLAVTTLSAQDQQETRPSSSDQSRAEEETRAKGGEVGWQPPVTKAFTESQKQRECRKYNNKLIAYYERVFLVEDCQRREVADEDRINRMTLNGRKIYPVENSTIIMIPEGSSMGLASSEKSFSCAQLENRYVISGASEIYWIDGCKRRSFPDWETFDAHRSKQTVLSREVLELDENQFRRLKVGKLLPSVMDQPAPGGSVVESEVDLIPLDEACQGVNGKVVSYFSKVYKIEGCRKREVRDVAAIKRMRRSTGLLPELSSEQWLSLPDGRPL